MPFRCRGSRRVHTRAIARQWQPDKADLQKADVQQGSRVADNEQWVEQNFSECNFGHVLRTQRLMMMAKNMLECPNESLPKQKKETRMQRLARLRESSLWGEVTQQAGRPPEGSQWIHVWDRGGDNFEAMCHVVQNGCDWLIPRSKTRRRTRLAIDLDWLQKTPWKNRRYEIIDVLVPLWSRMIPPVYP